MAMSAPSAITLSTQSIPAPASVLVLTDSAAPAPIPTPAVFVATITTDHGYENSTVKKQEYSNNKIEITGHVIVNDSIGGPVGAGYFEGIYCDIVSIHGNVQKNEHQTLNIRNLWLSFIM